MRKLNRRRFLETIPALAAVPVWAGSTEGQPVLNNRNELSPPTKVADRYRTKRKLIGYPPLPVERIPRVPGPEWVQSMRMKTLAYGDVTEAQAAALAEEAAREGFNVVIAEKNRYFMRDPGEKYGPDETFFEWGGPDFPRLVRNSRAMADALRQEGLRFIGHNTTALVTKAYLKKHPDQVRINIASGKPVSPAYGAQVACFINPEFRAEYLRRVRQYLVEVSVDGFMADEIQWFGEGACGCPWCRLAVKRDLGFDLPANGKTGKWFTSENPEFRRWLRWKCDQVVKLENEVRTLIRSVRSDGDLWIYMCNPSQPSPYRTDGVPSEDFPRYGDIWGLECEPPGQPRLYTYYWKTVAADLKFLAALLEVRGLRAPTWHLAYSVSNLDYLWNFFNATGQGARLWWPTGWFTPDEPPMRQVWQPLVAWEIRHDELLKWRTPLADVGVVFSALNRYKHPLEDLGYGGTPWAQGCNNLCHLLFDEHIPFRVLTDADLERGEFRGVKVVLLPSMSLMTDAAAVSIQSFVEKGGAIVATGDPGAYDENGRQRKKFALASLLGVESVRREISQPSWIELTKENPWPISRTPERLPNRHPFMVVRQTEKSGTVAAEMIAPDGSRSPGIFIRKAGNGTSIYIASLAERAYEFPFSGLGKDIEPGKLWQDKRDLRYRKLLRSLLDYVLRDPTIEVKNVPQGVLVEAHQQQHESVRNVQLHLGNFLGAELTTGVVPHEIKPEFPNVRTHLPDPRSPMRFSVRAEGVKDVYCVSPDYVQPFRLPFTVKRGRVEIALPDSRRYSIIVLNQGNDDPVVKLNRGRPIGSKPPAPVDLVYQVVKPLVGEYDPNACVMFAGTADLEGGKDLGVYKEVLSLVAYSSTTAASKVSGRFVREDGLSAAQLTVGALDDDDPSKVPLRITVNSTEIFKGPSPFPDNDWGVAEFTIPTGVLRKGANQVMVENRATNGSDRNPPWIRIAFLKISSRVSAHGH